MFAGQQAGQIYIQQQMPLFVIMAISSAQRLINHFHDLFHLPGIQLCTGIECFASRLSENSIGMGLFTAKHAKIAKQALKLSVLCALRGSNWRFAPRITSLRQAASSHWWRPPVGTYRQGQPNKEGWAETERAVKALDDASTIQDLYGLRALVRVWFEISGEETRPRILHEHLHCVPAQV